MTTRSENRASFPFAAQLLDDIRRAFPNARVLHARQAGRTIGTPETGLRLSVMPDRLPRGFEVTCPRLGKLR